MKRESELSKLSQELESAYEKSLYLMSNVAYCRSRLREILEVGPDDNFKVKKITRKKVDSPSQYDEVEF